MFDDLIINDSLDIIKFLNKLNLDLFFSKPQFKHLTGFVLAMVLKGFKGKISDVNELHTEKHRTTISRFLNKSSWDESLLLEEMKKYAIKRIWQRSKDTQQPIYIIIDDIVNEKTVPSSKSQNTIEGCSFHNSHKISDVNELHTEKHRITISRSLNKSSWDESLFLEEMKKYAIKRI